MERRTAIAIALSVTATFAGAGAAFAANVGLLREDPDPVGQLEVTNVDDLVPSTTTPTTPTTPQTIIIDVPVGAPVGSNDAGLPATAPSVDDNGGDRPAGVSDDEFDDDAYDDDDAHEADDDHGVDDDD